jgi:hypothetical protein
LCSTSSSNSQCYLKVAANVDHVFRPEAFSRSWQTPSFRKIGAGYTTTAALHMGNPCCNFALVAHVCNSTYEEKDNDANLYKYTTRR